MGRNAPVDIYDGCIDAGIGFADVRHEQIVATHAADGCARHTSKPGCVITVAGLRFSTR